MTAPPDSVREPRRPQPGAPQSSRLEASEDGPIPVGIWLLWLGFAIWAAYYLLTHAVPDFTAWLGEVRR